MINKTQFLNLIRLTTFNKLMEIYIFKEEDEIWISVDSRHGYVKDKVEKEDIEKLIECLKEFV